jgi:N4-(beta-N-acetylglucosaminyl)-L-asparaginase
MRPACGLQRLPRTDLPQNPVFDTLAGSVLDEERRVTLGKYSRREFIRTGAGIGAAALFTGRLAEPAIGLETAGPLRVVSSGNGLRATDKAMALLREGESPLDAVISGVNIVESDPEDMSVGYGGLPNADGVVQLDASVMDGPTHSAGAVAALERIKNPSKVARLVMERTPHVLLVGEGALKFALANGFVEEDLLTEKSRRAWQAWKKERAGRKAGAPSSVPGREPEDGVRVLRTHGTITCLALDERGRMAGVTTTSGLSFKLAGRVGDSPIIGAGLYVDNEVGAAGSTGLGEANLQTCACVKIVDLMERGSSPEQACLKVCEFVARKSRLWARFQGPDGRPGFGLDFYALNKKGVYGAAGLYAGGKYAVHDGVENKLRDCAYLFRK